MDSIFRVPFTDLALADVRAFLDDAGDEGITWEAKGPDPRNIDTPLEPRLLERAACGLANSIGGYVILGAAQDANTRRWNLPGIRLKGGEPGTWIDDVIGSLRPRPRIDDPVW